MARKQRKVCFVTGRKTAEDRVTGISSLALGKTGRKGVKAWEWPAASVISILSARAQNCHCRSYPSALKKEEESWPFVVYISLISFIHRFQDTTYNLMSKNMLTPFSTEALPALGGYDYFNIG